MGKFIVRTSRTVSGCRGRFSKKTFITGDRSYYEKETANF
jgi:hypothetical protein